MSPKPFKPGWYRPVEPGAIIRDPGTKRPLPARGGRVPGTTFWLRRYLAGEIEPCDPRDPCDPPKPKAKPAPAPVHHEDLIGD